MGYKNKKRSSRKGYKKSKGFKKTGYKASITKAIRKTVQTEIQQVAEKKFTGMESHTYVNANETGWVPSNGLDYLTQNAFMFSIWPQSLIPSKGNNENQRVGDSIFPRYIRTKVLCCNDYSQNTSNLITAFRFVKFQLRNGCDLPSGTKGVGLWFRGSSTTATYVGNAGVFNDTHMPGNAYAQINPGFFEKCILLEDKVIKVKPTHESHGNISQPCEVSYSTTTKYMCKVDLSNAYMENNNSKKIWICVLPYVSSKPAVFDNLVSQYQMTFSNFLIYSDV